MFYEKLSSFILSLLAPKMEAGRCFITFVSTYQTVQHYILYYSSFQCFAKSHYNSLTLQTLDNVVEGGYCDQQSPSLSDVSFAL